MGKTDQLPLHEQAANYMRELIYSRTWEVNQLIPTETQLMEDLHMSRGTIRKAVAQLSNEGLLKATRGRGTVVTEPNLTHPSGTCLLSFAESLRSQGIDFETQTLSLEPMEATPFLSQRLQIPVGAPVLFLRRVRSVDGEPIMYIENRMNAALVRGIEEVDFSKASLFHEFETLSGRPIGYSNVRYGACVAGAEKAQYLQVSESAPVLHMEQQVFLIDNVPIEWGNVWLRANRYVVGTMLQRVPGVTGM